MTPPPREFDRPLVHSVLDRLCSSDDSLRGLKQSVRRDLEDLLNTRVRSRRADSSGAVRELDASLAAYGLRDIAAADLGSEEQRNQFRLEIERAIRDFEPRLDRVRVRPGRQSWASDRTLRFHITARLRVQSLSEDVVFDTSVQPGTALFEVKEATA